MLFRITLFNLRKSHKCRNKNSINYACISNYSFHPVAKISSIISAKKNPHQQSFCCSLPCSHYYHIVALIINSVNATASFALGRQDMKPYRTATNCEPDYTMLIKFMPLLHGAIFYQSQRTTA